MEKCTVIVITTWMAKVQYGYLSKLSCHPVANRFQLLNLYSVYTGPGAGSIDVPRTANFLVTICTWS